MLGREANLEENVVHSVLDAASYTSVIEGLDGLLRVRQVQLRNDDSGIGAHAIQEVAVQINLQHVTLGETIEKTAHQSHVDRNAILDAGIRVKLFDAFLIRGRT
jgi:hypothetical protein